MSSIHYIPTMEEDRLEQLIKRKVEYLEKLDPTSKQAKMLKSEVVLLERVREMLSWRCDITHSEIERALARDIMQVRKHPWADKFVGVMAYYQFKEPWEWNERGEGENYIATIGGRTPRGYPWDDGFFGIADDWEPYRPFDSYGLHAYDFTPIWCGKSEADSQNISTTKTEYAI